MTFRINNLDVETYRNKLYTFFNNMFLNFQSEASKQAIPLPPPNETTALNTGEKKTYTEGMYRAHLKFKCQVNTLNIIANLSADQK